MIAFNPGWRGLDYVQDSAPPDGFAISFLPSIVSDSAAAIDQLDHESSALAFMQSAFRASAENMMDLGLVASAWA